MNATFDIKTWAPAQTQAFVEASPENGRDDLGHCCEGAIHLKRVNQPCLQIENGEDYVPAIVHMPAREDSAMPTSMDSLVSILHDCAESKDSAYAKHLHLLICSNGLELLGDHVICMFVRCGNFRDAQQVFDKLFSYYESCWSALIKGYAQYGEVHHAFSLLQEMQELCIPSNKGMLVALVQACTESQCVMKGHNIHLEIAKEGYERDVFVGSALVDMYGKCNQISEAQDVFEELPYRDTIAWTSLIGGHSECWLGAKAFMGLKEMELEGLYPDASTFVCVLKACDDIEVAQKIHAEVVKEGYESNPFISSSLVYTYASCGLLVEAEDVLSMMPGHNVVWNALIAGYVEYKLGEEALKSFEEMIMRGICPDSSTFVCCLKACGIVRSLDRGQQLHAEILKRGCEANLLVGNSLVDMYGKCWAPTQAQNVFNKLVVRDAAAWNSMLACFIEHDLGSEALRCAEQMLSEDVHGGATTFLYSLKACGSMGAMEEGFSVHSKIVSHGWDNSSYLVSNALLDMYAKCGAFTEALEVFDNLPARNVVSWNSLIAGCVKHGHPHQALSWFLKMQLEGVSPDVVSWNSLILGFAEEGEHEKAKALYSSLQEQGIVPDHVTFINILKACSDATGLEMGKIVHAQAHCYGGLTKEDKLILTNALMDMYSRCGSMIDTQRLFDAAGSRNAITWNALITGYTRQGEMDAALHYFEKMLHVGIKPCDITFLSILTVCSHGGLGGDKVENFFELMSSVYGIAPSVHHHSCLVDRLVRAGQLSEAAILLENFSIKPDPVISNTMLGACQKSDDVELEKSVHDLALRLREK